MKITSSNNYISITSDTIPKFTSVESTEDTTSEKFKKDIEEKSIERVPTESEKRKLAEGLGTIINLLV